VRSLLLVHGSASTPSVFDGWPESFPGIAVERVDLQAGLEVSCAGMEDYAQAIVRAAEPLARPLAVCGWSLGGLAAMLAAERVRPDALVLLEASPPLEVQGLREGGPRTGTFEAAPGAPPAIARRPESLWATGERDRGVSVPSLPQGTRTLVVYGDSFRHDRGSALAERYGAEQLDAGSATHYDMVLDRELRERVAAWLRATLPV
jgi:pimeloyl-ACP methyl ester carboxylesterase